MLTYKINKISEVETNSLSIFYKKVFFKRYKSLSQNWKWWYRVGHNNFEPLILSIDNKVVGQAGVLPVDLEIDGKKNQAIWFVDFAILPNLRGKGLGKILTKEWMKICPNQITFCNNESLKIFKKFGWSHNLSSKRILKPINYFKLIPYLNRFLLREIKNNIMKNKEIKPFKVVENFELIKKIFVEKKEKNVESYAEIVRDEKWLHWRLMECPYKDDLYFFEYKNNFIITHIYLDKNIKRLNILYQCYENKEDENDFFNIMKKWAYENNIDLLWAISGKKENEKNFSAIFNKTVNFAAWSSDNKIFNILQKGLPGAQGIDSDIDSSLYVE